MNRFDLFNKINKILKDNLVICNIGLPSQELYKIDDQPNYFYMLGSMGLSSSIGLGLSLSQKKNVISIDGDGSILMNMSTLATIGNRAPPNYTLLIVDNGSYGSTGDQKTFTNENTSLKNVAIGAGCKNVLECSGEETANVLPRAIEDQSNSYVIISKIKPGNTSTIPIPLNPILIRDRFRKFIGLVPFL
tara:strand:+ start:666 stop:1235 length:570 start_codon:yes stop_codon:yes gene_type:complete